jgi:antitoxin component of MazEF toxin-antitoxin module
MRVAKCGNSLAVRLPAALVEALGLKCAFTTDRSATTTNDKQQGPPPRGERPA